MQRDRLVDAVIEVIFVPAYSILWLLRQDGHLLNSISIDVGVKEVRPLHLPERQLSIAADRRSGPK